ncbi:MAG: trypsin-like peptidase domain-containing protein [Lachnospiraceae bacterium]|nr:trypsin-like peptidase domain-containing protein [Lachnospiraceae bacterium]
MNENEYAGGTYSSVNTDAAKNDAVNTEATQTEANTSYTGSNVYSSNINVGSTGNDNANASEKGYGRTGAGYQNNSYYGNYQNQNSNYQYGTSHTGNAGETVYQDAYTDAYGNTYRKNSTKPKRKPIKWNGFVKKAVIGVCFGVFFGLFAGVSFFAVKSATNFIESKDQTVGSAGVTEGEADDTSEVAEANAVQPETTPGTTTTVVTDVTQVVDHVMPSVVSVTNSFMQKQQDFFGQTMESEQTASGSGIIVGESDKELLIATNYHVVEGADSLKIQFIDGTEADAQMKGSDSGMDLAVMAVQLDSLSDATKNTIVIAKLGDSDSLKVGEPAIAIGNSLGYGQSVTTGVISAVNRSIVDDTQATPTGTGSKSGTSLIQTDAAINPGNSGGALLNMNGEVVGINSNKIGGSVVEGMGYAIPISSAKPIIEDLMTKTTKIKAAEDEKAYLGISGVDVSRDAAGTYGLPEGVYVAQVYEGTAAGNAGIIKGDIITKFDGSSVSTMEELQSMLQYYTAGTTVEVTIQQGSPTGYQEKTVAVTLGTRPEQQVQ